jgi:hypothetical protein
MFEEYLLDEIRKAKWILCKSLLLQQPFLSFA